MIEEIKKYLIPDLVNIVDGYVNGDMQFWKSKFDKTIKKINKNKKSYERFKKYVNMYVHICSFAEYSLTYLRK